MENILFYVFEHKFIFLLLELLGGTVPPMVLGATALHNNPSKVVTGADATDMYVTVSKLFITRM